MRAHHINEALLQVQQLRQSLLDKQLFRGFSGPVRAVSGTVALLMAGVMVQHWYPTGVKGQLLGWGAVFLFASVVNLGAMIFWFMNDRLVNRDIRRLRPFLDVLPPLFIGAVLTGALIVHRQFDFLFGIWMCMFGLTNLSGRYVLPPAIAWVGCFYMLCGAYCLLDPTMHFSNPWPMGTVFFLGEWISGMILYLDQRRYDAVCRHLAGISQEGVLQDGS